MQRKDTIKHLTLYIIQTKKTLLSIKCDEMSRNTIKFNHTTPTNQNAVSGKSAKKLVLYLKFLKIPKFACKTHNFCVPLCY